MSKTNGSSPNGNGPKKRKPKAPVNACTALQIVPKKKRAVGGGPVITSAQRRLFLAAYEANCGIVTEACEIAQISRRTFYRWLQSPTRVNAKFRKQLEAVKPKERLIDAAELTIHKGIAGGDVTAAIFTLKTQGRNRGWAERPDTAAADPTAIDSALIAYQRVCADRPNMGDAERQLWIRDLSEVSGVPQDLLLRRIKVLELTANV